MSRVNEDFVFPEEIRVGGDFRQIAEHIVVMFNGGTPHESIEIFTTRPEDVLIAGAYGKVSVNVKEDTYQLDISGNLIGEVLERSFQETVSKIVERLSQFWSGKAKINTTANGYSFEIFGPKTPLFLNLRTWDSGSDFSRPANFFDLATPRLTLKVDSESPEAITEIEVAISECAGILGEFLTALYVVTNTYPMPPKEKFQFRLPPREDTRESSDIGFDDNDDDWGGSAPVLR